MKTDNLKLIYVHKVGNNVKGEGIYEFLFSSKPEEIDVEDLDWHVLPAKGNALYPKKEDIDLIVSLKTDYFSLICLHELNDRKYLDGYYTIHAIAYDDIEFSNTYNIEYDDVLVFKYGETFKEVENKFYKREVVFNNKTDEFIHANKIKFKKEIEQ